WGRANIFWYLSEDIKNILQTSGTKILNRNETRHLNYFSFLVMMRLTLSRGFLCLSKHAKI
ncbi:MAG: hypothetical protein ACTING_08495, partial [Leuconostoc mesenteroides]